jgi:hypothetical protein
LKSGEAIVYNQSLFHGSYPNLTNDDRKVVLSCVKPKEAPMLFYHKEGLLIGQTHIKAYKITPELLLEQITALEKGEVPQNAILYSEFSDSITPNNMINNSIFEKHLPLA